MTNALHLTRTGRRRPVKNGAVAKVWLTDCAGRLESATVVQDMCWGNLIVRLDGRQARVSWTQDLNAYRFTNWL